jgi:hypothetical protein
VTAALAAAVIVVANPFGGGHTGASVTDNAYPTSLVAVRQGALSSQVTGVGSLTYAAQPDGSPYSIVNRAGGVFTALPVVGQVVRQGQAVYRVENEPVLLLDGATPAHRPLTQGDSGPDVQQLNADLVAMGYARRSMLNPSSRYFGASTAAALRRLQARVGQGETGSLAYGSAIFLPGPVRITKVSATLGASAARGGTVAQATSTRRQVEVNIDAAEQASVAAGDPVLITLPNYQDTPGVVASVGTVASGSGSSSPTIPVHVALRRPQDAGTIDQAPVRVQITSAGVPDALIVPVSALLAQPGGGYQVETVDAHGVHRLVAVTLGLFDDADGLVQVSGPLHPGQQVVVPAT